MNILFSKTAWEQYLEWQKEDTKIVARIHELIHAIQRDPFKGVGKTEPLRQNLKSYWSRRINVGAPLGVPYRRKAARRPAG